MCAGSTLVGSCGWQRSRALFSHALCVSPLPVLFMLVARCSRREQTRCIPDYQELLAMSLPSCRYVAPRLALIGDAAHAVHPLAGQGVNLGLGDAAALATALAFAREVGQDVGDVMLLQTRYEAPQQRTNMAMMAALEALWRGFGVQQGLAGAVRAAGLGMLNGIGPLKNSIMKYAMGLSSTSSTRQ